LYRPRHFPPNGIYDLTLYGNFQSLLYGVAQLVRCGLSDLFNVGFVGNGLLHKRKALVNKFAHAGNGLQDRVQLRLFESRCFSRSFASKPPLLLGYPDVVSYSRPPYVRRATGLDASSLTARHRRAATAGAQRRPSIGILIRHNMYSIKVFYFNDRSGSR
jgi:hypothetical protein